MLELLICLHLGCGDEAELRAAFSGFDRLPKVTFDFEGEFQRHDEIDPKSRLKKSYKLSGTITVNSKFRTVTWEAKWPHQGKALMERGSINRKSARLTSRFEGAKTPLGQVGGLAGYIGTTSYGVPTLTTWWPLASLLVTNDEDLKSMRHVGFAVRDGRNCRIVAHDFMEKDEARYWFDEERNVVVYSDHYRNKVLLRKTYVSNFSRYISDGKEIWLPATVKSELVAKSAGREKPGVWIPLDKPWGTYTYRVIKPSIRLGDKQAEVREVKFDPKAPVSDG